MVSKKRIRLFLAPGYIDSLAPEERFYARLKWMEPVMKKIWNFKEVQ